MFSNASVMIQGGTLINNTNHTSSSRGMDLLMEWVTTSAFHNSDELYEAPKCHPHTRIAVLDDLMRWVNESGSANHDVMMWLFGPAGAGKSAIAKKIAEIAAERDILIADFFFSRTSPTRNTKDHLVATLAYQLTVSVPDTRSYIEHAIERDPAIFNKNVQTQIDTLLIKPFQSITSTSQIAPPQKLIIIDGLDECNDRRAQVAILEAISHSFAQRKLPIIFLIVSRPEPELVTLFNCNEPLRFIHCRLSLDDTYRPYDDIRLFFSDKFEQIRLTHPLRSTIPISWPTQEMLKTLVAKSSGQFIYASTVVNFVESRCHRPSARLNIILGISPPGTMNPFAELDGLYNHLLSSVDDIQLTLRVLSFYVMTPNFVSGLRITMSPEVFLSLEPGDIQLALMNLSSILTYHESSGAVKVLHASLVDFLSDKRRSTAFYIDTASICTDFVHRILQYVKGPDGIQAGDIRLFRRVIQLFPWIRIGQLSNDVLNFDLDAFINASTRRYYRTQISNPFLISGSTIGAFDIWVKILNDAALDEGDRKAALDRLNKSFELRLQIYQSDWRLQLLLTLAVAKVMYSAHFWFYNVPYCRCVDILLEMDDHVLHLVDQDALDLRHTYMMPGSRLIGMISTCVDGDRYASAALHCMHFLSSSPNYSETIENPEMHLIFLEWRATCAMTLEILCTLLQRANTSPELVEFISNHDIHPAVQECFSADRVSEVNVHILAFLSRASVCVNWRLTSEIRRSLVLIHPPSSVGQDPETIRNLKRQRLDQCCSKAHIYSYI